MRSLRPILRRLVKRVRSTASRWIEARRREDAAAAARRVAAQPRTLRLVVFVANKVAPRVSKMGYALRSIGWRVVLLCQEELSPCPALCFDETLRYGSPADALLLATRFRPVAYHVFASWDFEVAALFIRHKPGKVVFDDYDVMAGMLDEALAARYARQMELERLCLTEANALCCRSLETQYAKRRLGYRFNGPRILWLDGCWGDVLPTAASGRRHGEFHFVFCGNVPTSRDDPTLAHQVDLFLSQAGMLSSERIHLHVYPSRQAWGLASEDGFSRYRALESATPFFHLHEPLSLDDLPREIASFDAGFFDARMGLEGYSPWKPRYAASNKIFDYLDAGLPVLVRAVPFQEFLVRRVGAAVPVPREGSYRPVLERLDWDALRRNSLWGRSRYAVARHAPRLGALYAAL